jgi:hypothetical protein
LLSTGARSRWGVQLSRFCMGAMGWCGYTTEGSGRQVALRPFILFEGGFPMRGHNFRVGLIPLLGLMAACDSVPITEPETALASAPLNAPVYRASGGGTFVFPNGRSSYGFHASVHGTGAVKGQFELHFTNPQPVDLHGVVTCLDVDFDGFGDGPVAWFGGVVSRSSGPLWPVGQHFVWQVQDRGEGAKALPDLVSSFFPLLDESCVERPDFVMRPWTNGNVQISRAARPLWNPGGLGGVPRRTF